jgi:hypothetical protein
MTRFSRYLTIWSILSCVLFYVNTYLFKYFPRDVFYLLGLYIPTILIVFVIGYFFYFKFNKKELEKLPLILTFFFNLITLLLYGYYMQQALIVR